MAGGVEIGQWWYARRPGSKHFEAAEVLHVAAEPFERTPGDEVRSVTIRFSCPDRTVQTYTKNLGRKLTQVKICEARRARLQWTCGVAVRMAEKAYELDAAALDLAEHTEAIRLLRELWRIGR